MKWRFWRPIVLIIIAATILVLLLGPTFDITTETEVLSGISIKTILGLANSLVVYILWKLE